MDKRHRIISNDWLAAHLQSVAAQLLLRAAEMLERVDFTPNALGADLGPFGFAGVVNNREEQDSRTVGAR